MAENAKNVGDMRECPECGALNPAAAEYCDACGCMFPKIARPAPAAVPDAAAAERSGPPPLPGESATEEPPPLPGESVGTPAARTRSAAAAKKRGRSGRRGRRSPEDVEKMRARQEFARVKSTVQTVRMVYIVSAGGAAVNVFLWHVLLPYTMQLVLGDGFGTWFPIMSVALYLQFGLLTVGAVLVLRAPLLWTVIGAAVWTLQNIMQWWLVIECMAINRRVAEYEASPLSALFSSRPPVESIEVGMIIVIAAFWSLIAAALWFAASQAARVQRLMRENPELQIERKGLDPYERVDGGVGDKLRKKREEESGNEAKMILKIGGGVVIGLVVLLVFLLLSSMPPAVDGAVDRFTAAWRSADLEAIDSQLQRGSVAKEIRRHGWGEATPTLGEPEMEVGDDRVDVTWPCAGDEIRARFVLVEEAWQLQDIVIPELDPPAIGPAIERYRVAWSKPGMDALVEQFRPDLRPRFGAAMRRMFEKRDWSQKRPDLGDVDPGRVRNGNCSVLFAIGFDELKVRFEYWHPRWHVTGIIPPQ